MVLKLLMYVEVTKSDFLQSSFNVKYSSWKQNEIKFFQI